MLQSVENERIIALGVQPNEDGFSAGTDAIQGLENQAVEDNMAFVPILNGKGKITVYPLPIRGQQRQKRDANGNVVYQKDALGNDTQIPVMEPAIAEACRVFVFTREMELDENAQPKRDANGKVIFKEGSKWEPVMEENPVTGTTEPAIRYLYKGGPTRRLFPVKVGQMADPEDATKLVDDPNTIVANLPQVTAKGSFVNFVDAHGSFTQAIIDAAVKCGVPAGKETKAEDLANVTSVITYEVIARPWTRNPQYRAGGNAARCRRQPLGAYNFASLS